ncbi:MAG: GNAT family N-acetyltransferase [Mycobacteriaceae bacterium]
MLPPERHRDAAEVFGGAYLVGPVTDRTWSRSVATYKGSTVHGVVEDDGSIGAVARAFDAELVVPGARVRAAAVSSVGVRADRRRRGYLRALMHTQLSHLRDDGMVAVTLRATEAGIYGRFGYGAATSYATLTVDRARAAFRVGAPGGRTLRMMAPTAALQLLPQAHERILGTRPGAIARPLWWWTNQVSRMLDKDEPLWVLCTENADGQVDGWVVYTAKHSDGADGQHCTQVQVVDLVGVDADTELALWRAVLAVDLAQTVRAEGRPLDEVLPLSLVDARAARLSAVEDETWLRLLDVPAALAARSYGAGDPVVVAVTDTLFPENSGRYRLGAGVVERTEEAEDVVLDVAELACVYLGATSFADLAAAGRLTGSAEALVRADVLFATPRAPWSGTYF